MNGTLKGAGVVITRRCAYDYEELLNRDKASWISSGSATKASKKGLWGLAYVGE